MRTVDDIADQLLLEIEIISNLLKQSPYTWSEIEGVHNILKNKNKTHYPKIKRKLFMDYRMIADHQINIQNLNEHLDNSYTFAALLETPINQEK